MNKTSSQVALVAGSSGIVGRQLVNTLLHRGWEVIGLSHRALSQPGAIPMIHVDLRDARHSAQALQPLSTVTHIFYSAWMNAGNWSEMVEPDVSMLRNLVSHVEQNAPLQASLRGLQVLLSNKLIFRQAGILFARTQEAVRLRPFRVVWAVRQKLAFQCQALPVGVRFSSS